MDEDETNEKRQERMEGSVEADTGSVEARPVAAWQPATDRHTHTHTHTHTHGHRHGHRETIRRIERFR